MQPDKLDALGPALAEVGVEAVGIAGGEADALYLYVEAAEGWVSPSLFKDEGGIVTYLSPRGSMLSDLLIAARETEPDLGKRWSVLEYTIEDGSIERRDVFLKARYGDKPIVYPALEGDFFELRPEDE